MKPSGILAVCLSVLIPSGSFAQSFAAESAFAGVPGAIPLVPGGLGASAPLTPPVPLAASLTPTAIPSARLNVAMIPALPTTLPTAAKIPAVAKLPGEPARELSTGRLAALFDGMMEKPAHDAVPAPSAEREMLKSYKRVLADGTGSGNTQIRPFGFLTPNGWRRARSLPRAGRASPSSRRPSAPAAAITLPSISATTPASSTWG